MCFYRSGIEIRGYGFYRWKSNVLEFELQEPIDHIYPSLAFRSAAVKHGIAAEHNSETILRRILNGHGMSLP
jgi:hypothetical protein